MLIGSTYAWFTDQQTLSGNVIKSGKLDFVLEKWNGSAWVDASTDPIFNYSLWEPGHTQVVNLRVRNVGNLALKWESSITSAGELSDLADAIVVYVKTGDTVDVKDYVVGVDRYAFDNESLAGNIKKYTLRDFIAQYMPSGELAANGEAYFGLVLQMPTSTGNEYQNMDLNGTFNFTVVATQDAVESDYYDNTYDADAEYKYN
jgi:predicted ribosomally synthesized peptide with SipW-like signal peptide